MPLDEVGAAARSLLSDTSLGEVYHNVYQGILSAGYLDQAGVVALFVDTCYQVNDDATDEDEVRMTTMAYIQKITLGINSIVKPFGVAIRSGSCELSAQKYFMFVYLEENAIVRFRRKYAPVEVDLFELCVDRILRKYDNFAVPYSECVDAILELDPSKSKSQAEVFLQEMLDKKYLIRYMISQVEYDVTLGVKTMREFETVLTKHYSDVITKCEICHMNLLQGYRCPKCKLLCHKHCYLKFTQGLNPCPNCKLFIPKAEERKMLHRFRDTDKLINSKGGNDIEIENKKQSRGLSETWNSERRFPFRDW